MPQLNLGEIQNYLQGQEIDGWLIFDFRGQNYIANSFFDMGDHILTRRWFYFIPKNGAPALLIHKIERGNFPDPPRKTEFYISWKELRDKLAAMLQGSRTVAMEYSPNCANPYVSCVDAGTIELVRGLGVEVVTSANLVQAFEGLWDDAQLQSHIEASEHVQRIKDDAFALVGEKIGAGSEISERDVQTFIYDRLADCQMVTDEPPIVAVNANASNPHYAPTAAKFSSIKEGDSLLIDLFGKMKSPRSVYADITWMGFVGEHVPEKNADVFRAAADGRDAGVRLLEERFTAKQGIQGWEVDKAVRDVINEAGYGEFFDHRTGHSLDTQIHGSSVHMDNLETKDEREIVPGVGFTIEPGIYLDEFGTRTEINVYFSEEGPKIYGPVQKEVLPILGLA